jgi:hypothetical protein
MQHLETGTTECACPYANLDLAGVSQLPQKGAVRIDDDRTYSIWRWRETENLKGFDSGLLKVTEIHRVIDMPHGIHVTPAYRHARPMK